MLTKTQSRIKPPVWAVVDPNHSLARGLAGCWLLNEGAGRSVRDVASCRRDGNLSGNSIWSAGSFGSAIEFDGADDWISMGDCLDLGADDISVLAIIKYNIASQPDSWDGIHIGAVIGKGYLDGAGRGYGLLVETDNRLYWQVRSQETVFAATSDVALNDGRWHLAVGVCDRDDPTGVRLYIDGVRQDTTSDATALNGIDLSGSRAFAIGSRQDETSGAWYWDFAGSVAMACVWKRVLSDGEIRRLRQSPFEMLSPRRSTPRFRPSGNIVSCAGSIQSGVSASATLRVIRSCAGAVDATSSLQGDLHVPGLVSLSGVVRESSTLEGTLAVTAARPAFKGMLRTEPAWRREALFRGRTREALALGTALTRGWFWVRRNGCTAVYRGSSVRDVDWSRILYVAEPRAQELSLPRRLSHTGGSTECYVVRRFNGCGRQDKTVAAAAMLRITPDGQLALPRPNAVLGLTGRQIDADRVHLTWFYCPLDQATSPDRFDVRLVDVSGRTDPGAPVGVVRYEGRRFYWCDVSGLVDGEGGFAVRAVSRAGIESESAVAWIHRIAAPASEQMMILIAKPV